MAALSVQPAFPIFTDTDGTPLENGYVWIGVENLEPSTNPISVFWDKSLSIPAAQPIRTAGGYPARNGSPGRLYVNGAYSIKILNKNGSLVASSPIPTEAYSDLVLTDNYIQSVETYADISSALATLEIGQQFSLIGHTQPGIGGGVFNVVSSAGLTSNNGTIVVSGAKAAVRTDYDYITVHHFGADPTGVAYSTAAFQDAAVAVNNGIENGAGPGGTVFVPRGTYLVSRVGLRDTILIGEDRENTIIKCGANAAAQIYFLDAATDRDGVTANTAGGGGFKNLTVDGDNKTNVNGIRTYGGGVTIENMRVTRCRTGVALGLPIWATVRNVYSVLNSVDGFYTYSGPADLATSTTFQDCWADQNGASGFYITQLTYSTFVNCASQGNAGAQWLVDGNTNGVSFTAALQFIGCAVEGGAQHPFYFRRVRDVSIIGPRIFSPPAGYDLITLDDCTGTIIDFGHSGSLSPNYMLGIVSHTGGNGTICLIGGSVTFDPANEALISSLGTSNSQSVSRAFRFLWNNATAAQRVYSEIDDVDGTTGLAIFENGGSRLAAFRRTGTPIFSTNGAISAPATNLNNGDTSFYVDTAASELNFVCKDGSGNVKTGKITLT